MKRHILLGSLLLVAGTLIAAQTSPKDDVKAAAKNLADKANYSWKSTVEQPAGGGGGGGAGRGRQGPTDGKTEKDGFTVLTMTRGENKTEAVLKSGKGAIKGPDGWIGLGEAFAAAQGGDRGNAAGFVARTLTTFKNPAAQAEDLAAKTKDLKKNDDAYVGELNEEGLKSLLNFGRPGGNAPAPQDAKGNVKIWIKDGMITKYEFRVQATVTFNNNDIKIDRTTTVEIKDVGSTKVEVPDEAKGKMSAVSI